MKSKQTVWLFLVFALQLLLALPASAGHYRLIYEEKGQVSVELFEENGRQKILFRILPLTGDRTAGPAVLRFDGVYIAEWTSPAYECEFSLSNDCIPSLVGNSKKGGELCIPWLKGDPTQKVDLRRLTKGIHTVEAYFASRDGNGHLDRNRTAAPATQFHIEEIAPTTAATTNQGQAMTPEQLKDAISQAYDQGVQAGKAAAKADYDSLYKKFEEATKELNELRVKLAERPTTQTQPPSGPKQVFTRYVPFKWEHDKKDWPALREEMILTRDGKFVAKAIVVDLIVVERKDKPPYLRLWLSIDLPADFVVDGTCKISRGPAIGSDKSYRKGETN